MKTLIYSICGAFLLPLFIYTGFRNQFPSDPDVVYIKEPSLFSGKWQKVAYSSNFSEYIEPRKIEKNIDFTVEIVTMRNYFKLQKDNSSDKNRGYQSQISYETINCFTQTIAVSKMYLLSGHYAGGSLVEEPIEPIFTPIHVNDRSIGFSKIRKVCDLAERSIETQYIKSDFMSNI
jgi:hypothetical protein